MRRSASLKCQGIRRSCSLVRKIMDSCLITLQMWVRLNHGWKGCKGIPHMESTSARGSGPFHLTEPRAVRASVVDARLSHCFLSTPPRRTGNGASTEASVVLASLWSKWLRLKVQGPFGCRIQWRVGRHRLKERAAPVSYVTTQSCTCGIYLATVTTSIALRERVPGSVPVVDLNFMVRTEVSM